MGTERMPKEIYKETLYGSAKKGRPWKRWIQDMLEDLKRTKMVGESGEERRVEADCERNPVTFFAHRTSIDTVFKHCLDIILNT